MRKIVLAAVAALTLAGCTTAERDAALGGAAGAAIGGLATGRAAGAVVGGVVGAASGVLIGKATRTGWCVYRDRYGRLYEARCRGL
ncbi:lipoprotein [Nitratireductor mangrovi]|uniref:Type IV secretion system putative lipoprotein virB7 n=1 Tax=Nitratireductor mangrovi TaxID=2599600 RepID=A0A5B8KWA1_9HYPH|nr:glycine zipper domain-containing protein [Nitratireductor mangrovi]QDY99818.1 lipoprotein [Nitratireductor mangrovi]